MTQSYNLSQLANNLNTAGQLDATDGLVGAVPPANGGTGLASYNIGDVMYASGTTTLAKLPDVATGNALISGGVNTAPSYGKIGLTTHVSGTLPIANGGTNGTATPTAGAVIYGNGTAYAATAAGTTGQVLTSQGTGTPIWASAGGQLQYQLFTSSTTWTCPANVTRVKVQVIGGGGGGGGTTNANTSGGLGGCGVNYYTVVPGTVYTVTVGAGGAGGTIPLNGSAGGTTSFGSFISATGGGGGIYSPASSGAWGSCANALGNTTGNFGSYVYGVFGGSATNSSGSNTAVTWSASTGLIPGALGAGGVIGSGGVSGAVFIEYIG